MTVHEKILYGSFAGCVELREDIVRRAGVGVTRAVLLRNAIGIIAALSAVSQLANSLGPVPWSTWSSSHSSAIMLGLGGLSLLAAANEWCCRQRASDSRARLLAFISRLPVR